MTFSRSRIMTVSDFLSLLLGQFVHAFSFGEVLENYLVQSNYSSPFPV